jgi:hypothetical protein
VEIGSEKGAIGGKSEDEGSGKGVGRRKEVKKEAVIEV